MSGPRPAAARHAGVWTRRLPWPLKSADARQRAAVCATGHVASATDSALLALRTQRVRRVSRPVISSSAATHIGARRMGLAQRRDRRPAHPTQPFGDLDRADVEQIAHSIVSTGVVSAEEAAEARAELIRRDREYDEKRERDRRAYEDAREASRREFEIKRFTAEGNRAATQQQHEERLAQMQAGAAREAASIQARATERAAERQVKVASWSAAAAIAAATAAFASLAVTALAPLMK